MSMFARLAVLTVAAAVALAPTAGANPVDPPGALSFGGLQRTYVLHVLSPMLDAWQDYKGGDKEAALRQCVRIVDDEVRQACIEWLCRRKWG